MFRTNVIKTRQIKKWIYQAFQLGEEISVSVNPISYIQTGDSVKETGLVINFGLL